MKRFWFFIFLSIATSTSIYCQTFKVTSLFDNQLKKGTLSGKVLDEEFNNHPLAFVTITVKETNISTTSNQDGSFSFNLKPGFYTLLYHFVGYQTIEVENVKVSLNETILTPQKLKALAPEMPFLISELE
jgi:hypothetical protein